LRYSYGLPDARKLSRLRAVGPEGIIREKVVMDGFTFLLQPYFDDALSRAREVFAMMDGLTLRWLHAGQNFDLTDAWEDAGRKLLAASEPSDPKLRTPQKDATTSRSD